MSTASSFISAIIGTEALSLIICLVLLMGSIMEGKKKSKRTHWFLLLIISTIAGCFCDLLSWLLEGHSEWNFLLYLTTFCSMIMTIVIVGVFISYLSAYVSERKRISKFPVTAGWITVSFGLILTIVTGITGNLFTFENGCFIEKPLYTLYVIVNTFYLIIGILVMIVYKNVMDRYDKLAGYAYILIPMISAGIELFVDGWEFTYPAITVSLLIVYIMLQSDRTKRLESEGIIASYQATHDALTGLLNRKAYQDRIQMMKSKEEYSGIIFGDLNGLKSVNDTYGHEAGDQLLIRFAQVLKEYFRMNEIFRISGDEFICLMENIPEEIFRKRVSDLEGVLNMEQPPLASVGAAFGSNKDIETLSKEAENIMYAKKKIVHESFPKIRR